MSGFVDRLVARGAGLAPAAAPPRRSRFEDPFAGPADALTDPDAVAARDASVGTNRRGAAWEGGAATTTSEIDDREPTGTPPAVGQAASSGPQDASAAPRFSPTRAAAPATGADAASAHPPASAPAVSGTAPAQIQRAPDPAPAARLVAPGQGPATPPAAPFASAEAAGLSPAPAAPTAPSSDGSSPAWLAGGGPVSSATASAVPLGDTRGGRNAGRSSAEPIAVPEAATGPRLDPATLAALSARSFDPLSPPDREPAARDDGAQVAQPIAASAIDVASPAPGAAAAHAEDRSARVDAAARTSQRSADREPAAPVPVLQIGTIEVRVSEPAQAAAAPAAMAVASGFDDFHAARSYAP